VAATSSADSIHHPVWPSLGTCTIVLTRRGSPGRPEEDKERWVIFDFGDNGGWVVMSLLPTTTPTSIFTSVQSILLTHMVWKGNPILLGNY